ncbi:Uncharacterised protein [Mycobacteroides abscessus]|uniref:helix-turn-helix domain-containing protein n=1 Tax=Mycobacteroides abscessus TaxID=36809 RepID=UPI0005E69C41|nr:helix-turn-helix domain-containing protein [Mycobacteroides abscessus]CPX20595.1 Uncharacterised protein [Mycobacteroides abscessus]CRG61221.1 Uncharacterised protein [Mycobacteroides abscessus]
MSRSEATTARRDGDWLMREAPELVTLRVAAEVMGLHPNTLIDMAARGDVPCIKSERRTYVPRQVLLDLLHLPRISRTLTTA